MKKSKLFILGAAVICSLSMAGLSSCGNDANLSPYRINFWHTFGQAISNQVQKQIDKFTSIVEKKEGIKLDVVMSYQGGYSDIVSKVTKSFSTGNQPTITVAYPDHVALYKSYEDNPGEYVVKLDDYINSSEYGLSVADEFDPAGLGLTDFVSSFIEEGQGYKDEGTYSFPYIKSSEIMLYNVTGVTSLLQAYGYEGNVDTYLSNCTWGEFMDLLRFAKKDLTKYGSSLKVPLTYDSDSNFYITQSYQRNIPFISMNNGVGSVDFKNDQAKKMITDFKTDYDAGLFATKGTNNGEYSSDNFKASKCLFTIGSTGGSGYSDPGTNFKVGVAKIPPISKTERADYVSQGVTLAMMNNSKVDSSVNDTRKKYAWELIKYLTNSDNSTLTALASEGYIPARKSAYKTTDYVDFINEKDFMGIVSDKVINDISGHYFNYPVFKGTDTIRTQVGGIITSVMLGMSTVDEAFNEAYTNSMLKL